MVAAMKRVSSTFILRAEVSLDGRVEELDLLSELLSLLVQLSSLLLDLADVLGGLLQRGGFADLSAGGEEEGGGVTTRQ